MSSIPKSVIQLMESDAESVAGHSCGYCKSTNGSKSWGVWAHHLAHPVYQDLMNRGWRRSGKYCYKPLMRETCCPMYTIRCEAPEFRLRRSHRRLLKRVANFLVSGQKFGDTKNQVVGLQGDGFEPGAAASCKALNKTLVSGSGDVAHAAGKMMSDSTCTQKQDDVASLSLLCNAATTAERVSSRLREGKARWKRFQRRLQHLEARSVREKRPFDLIREEHAARFATRQRRHRDAQNCSTLEQLLLPSPNSRHKLQVRHLRSAGMDSAAFRDTLNVEHELYQRYQQAVHGDKPSKCDRSQFTRFLCDSPLIPEGSPEEDYKCDVVGSVAYGSFHQQYWLDDRLIAVGVIDVVSQSVSSVYVFYDPEFSWMQLGTYTALCELAFTRRLAKREPLLRNYYMGFYIHSCRKMKYKGQFSPSYLACPEVYQFVALKSCLSKLEKAKYCRLIEDAEAKDEGSGSVDDTLVLVMYNDEKVAMPFSMMNALMPKKAGALRYRITIWAAKAGRRAAQNSLIIS